MFYGVLQALPTGFSRYPDTGLGLEEEVRADRLPWSSTASTSSSSTKASAGRSIGRASWCHRRSSMPRDAELIASTPEH